MKHGSLFSGIGGFDLAAEWKGWNNIFHCEWNEFGQKILKYYWPNAISYADITKTDFTIHRGSIDILTGGFPCQPYSQAGKRLGKDDDRHLWPEMLRAIGEIQPRWVVGENVCGLTNWNGGLVFDEVQSDLESQGYEVTPFLLPAVAVNAPHRRDRIWFVAYSGGNGCKRSKKLEKINDRGIQKRLEERYEFNTLSSNGDTADSNKLNGDLPGLRAGEISQQQASGVFKNRTPANNEHSHSERCGQFNNASKPEESGFGSWKYPADWNNWPTQSPVCNGDDGISSQLDGITFSKWRNESIKAGGNAIVPQVAYQIFNAVEQYQLINKI